MKYFRYLFFCMLIFFNNSLRADEMLDLGKKIFYGKGNCSSCHVLSDSASYEGVGQNLYKIKPSLERIMNVVNSGIGVMPSYEGVLSYDEIDSLAFYVYESIN